MSLLIQAIPQWSVVYTTCFETMWPKSGEKLNYFLGESQGLSVNLDRLCSRLRWLAQLSVSPLPGGRGRALVPELTHPLKGAPQFREQWLPYHPPPGRLERWVCHHTALKKPMSPVGTRAHQDCVLRPGRSRRGLVASVDKRQAPHFAG